MADISTESMRLQAFLARCGVASRRASEEIILSGRVTVNGTPATLLGTKVGPLDVVALDGKKLVLETRLLYLALNKPTEFICSASDPEGRRLARSLLPPGITERVYNVGRLDYRSSGLILFTNDGDFALSIGHPSAEIEKEYIVEATGVIEESVLDSFRKGISVEDVLYKCVEIERLGRKSVRIVLVEGKNREIRRVFSHFHLHPARLHRIRIGPVLLGSLPSGLSRPLSTVELSALKSAIKGAPSHGRRD